MINNDYPPFTMINTFSTNTKSQFYHQSPVWLVVLTILKNMKVNGEDYPIYCGKKKNNVWNHQPAVVWNKQTYEKLPRCTRWSSACPMLVWPPLQPCAHFQWPPAAHMFNARGPRFDLMERIIGDITSMGLWGSHMRTMVQMVLVYKNPRKLGDQFFGFLCWCAYSSTMVRIWGYFHGVLDSTLW